MSSVEVSVIVPFYNTERYLENCIESIILQTYRNFELILIDDGSTDRCAEICRRYVDKDCRVKYFYQDNRGASEARNHGIEQSSGSYITFIDSDDWVDNDYIETMISAIDGYDIVQVGNHVFTADGRDNRGDQNNELLPTEIDGYSLSKYLLEGKYQSGGVPWGKLYRKYLWESIRFPSIQRFEDVAVLYKIYWNAKNIKIIPVAKYCYRSERYGSIMHSPYSLEWLEIINIEEKRSIFYKEKNAWQLYTLSRYELINQLIRTIKLTKKELPEERDALFFLKQKLVQEVKKQWHEKKYIKKKLKMTVKAIGVLIC